MKAKTAKAKPPAKSTAKTAAKAGKVKTKPAAKAAKAPAKTAKSPAKAAAVKPTAKATKAPARSAVKATKASAAKPANKKAVIKKPVTKTVKLAAKTPAVKLPSKTPANKATVAKVAGAAKKQDSPLPKSAKTSMPISSVSAPAKPSPKSAVPTPSKPVRKSRLEQLTVPSMPQSVASTAAKSSYTQIPDQPAPIPPVYVAAKKDSKLANNWKHKPAEELSDAEVLAMPDSEYMKAVQTTYFRSKLVKLKNDMLNNAGETTVHLREETVIVPDPADRATIEEEHALELRTRDRERKLLKKIAQSIVRIDAGDYGYCDETGESIGVGRLLARPTATLSLEAQQRRELKQKMFGD